MIGPDAFIWKLPRRLGRIRRLVWDDEHNRTYHPDRPRKSKFRILKDLLWWLVRHREVALYYYYYGLDCQDADDSNLFSFNEFRKVRDRFNARRIGLRERRDYTGRTADGVILLRHKIVFGLYLMGLGFPTPQVHACGFGRSLYWFDTGTETGLEELKRRDLDVFVKNCQVDQGARVFPLRCTGGSLELAGEPAEPEDVPRRAGAGSPFLLQSRIEQHSLMAELYPGSVNTIRLATVATPDGPKVLGAVLRLGAGGDYRDNWSTGGMGVAIDRQSGTLGRYGLLAPKYGRRVEAHPDTGVRFLGRDVPFFREATEMACLLHRFMYGVGTIGWDIAITPDGPSFIEGNDEYSGITMQGPLGGIRREFMELLDAWDKVSLAERNGR